MKDQINTLIADQLKLIGNGTRQSIYWKLSESDISLGDESGLFVQIWERNPHLNDEESDEIESNFTDALMLAFNQKMNLTWAGQGLTHTINTGLTSQFDTPCGDTFKLHQGDHSIYLTVFQSGQY